MDTVINDFKSYMESANISIKAAASELGCDRSTLSKIFNGTYNSDSAPIKTKMIQMMENPLPTSDPINYNIKSIYMTKDATQILAMCDYVQNEKLVGAIVGHSGNGKSYTLKSFQKSSSKVVYVECDSSMASRDFMTTLEMSIGLEVRKGSLSERASYIKTHFEANPGYLLIVDEADKLITRDTIKKIEILRNLHDQVDEDGEAYFGLILAGEPELMSLLRQHNERMRNRIDMLVKLGGLTKNEVLGYIKHVGITDITEKAERELVNRGTDVVRGGCFRLLHRTLKNVIRVANGKSVTTEHVEQASRMMYEM